MPQESTKRNWLITYGASYPSITHELLDSSHIQADECYTLTQRDLKYTLINATDCLRSSAVVLLLKANHIIPQEVLGMKRLRSMQRA